MQLKTIPRVYVCTSLQMTRAPLTIWERVTGNDENEQWAPALAFDAFGATVKQVLGSLLGDAELVHEGDLERARVATVRDAIELETIAAQKKAGADEVFQARRAADERKRKAARDRAQRREQDAERKRTETKRTAADEARERRARSRVREEQRADELAKKERSNRAAALAKEREALAASKRAAATKREVLETDKKLRATKARRSAS